MKLTVYGLILFFVCLNMSFYLVSEQNVIGDVEYEPYEDIDELGGRIFDVDVTTDELLLGMIPIGVGTILGWVAGNIVTGGTVGLIIGVLNIFFPLIRWVTLGFPAFLIQIGTPTVLVTVVSVGMSLVWLWFILGILVGRDLQT